jgi:hypothetical protein
LGPTTLFEHGCGQAAGLKSIDVHTFCAQELARILLSIGNEVIESDQAGLAAAVARPTGQEQYAQQKHRGCDMRPAKVVPHRWSVSCLLTTCHRAGWLIHPFAIRDVFRGLWFPDHSDRRDTL